MTASSPQVESPPRSEVLPPLSAESHPGGWTGHAYAAIGAVVSVLYLANIGAGILEIGPDNLPVVGNLDEVFFSFLLLFCLRKLGIDLLPHLRRSGSRPAD